MSNNIMTWDEFEASTKRNWHEFAFLFGNGFPKSYPDNNFKGKFELSSDDYNSIWENVTKEVGEYIKRDSFRRCPEKLLDYIRVCYSLEFVDKFKEKQGDLTGHNTKHPTNFLNQFKSIYTLNYDFFTYVGMFKDGQFPFNDGFMGRAPISREDIAKRLNEEGKKPFYFLHGAFHIFEKGEETPTRYYKVCSDKKNKFSDKVDTKYKKTREQWKDYMNGKRDMPDDPILVFASLSRYKNAAVHDDDYLEFCHNQLKNEKNIITFGCSFVVDDYLLKAIIDSGTDKKLYFGVYDEENKKYVEDKITKYKEKFKTNHEVNYVCTKDANGIWPEDLKCEWNMPRRS